MNSLISNLLMQPKPTDAVVERPERELTLIEKLERELAKNCRLNNWDLGFQAAIDIVKQHSEWISVDERLPPNVTDEEKNYLLLIHKEWGCFIIGQYIKENDEINSYMGNDPISDFAYWMPIPQPPSEAQDV